MSGHAKGYHSLSWNFSSFYYLDVSLYLTNIKNYFFVSFLKVRTLKRFGEPFEVGNRVDKVNIKTSYGVSLLLFEPRSQKVRSYQANYPRFFISELGLKLSTGQFH
ncbi:hypothetical protein EAF07_07135 [Streptococcus hillyeri]|uniref:Uncharacterized protein n=1 Tax=Streptococcus hillyeri TaxID=2282420 RepID=A0A3L9DRN8_9STRE|nr:hypothetical protein EAF07_07135 [Streptococcus hillyeri]